MDSLQYQINLFFAFLLWHLHQVYGLNKAKAQPLQKSKSMKSEEKNVGSLQFVQMGP